MLWSRIEHGHVSLPEEKHGTYCITNMLKALTQCQVLQVNILYV